MSITPDPIMALTVAHADGARTVWAFDDVAEFEAAEGLLNAHGIDHTRHHGVDAKGSIYQLTAPAYSGAHWISLSDGLNECEELRRCLDERGELRDFTHASFEDFQASRARMSGRAFARLIGDAAFDEEPHAALMVYGASFWITETGSDAFHLILETEEHEGTTDDLPKLERRLFEWARDDGQISA